MFKSTIAVAVLALIGFGAFVRFNPVNPDSFHVDPETVERPSYPGHVLVRPGGDIEPTQYADASAAVAERLEEVILSTPRTTLLAGNLQDGWASYVTRSSLWGFPDIASVKLVEVDGGTELRVYSRLRYGYADMGVNRARVESWLSQL
ncbi:MAG: DUF1499 domain-containing protein [Litoreibacter sp.]|nr:DUF1499 domain-containing protein [Litoreibacter sp.]